MHPQTALLPQSQLHESQLPESQLQQETPHTNVNSKLRRSWRPAGSWATALLLAAASGLTVGCSGDGEPGPAAGAPTGDVTGVMPGTTATVTPTGTQPGVPVAPVTPGVPTTDTPVNPTSTGPGQTPPPAPIDVENADCSVPKAPGTLMRRLTTFEYNNAVFDLLGIQPTTQIPLDGVTDGFNNNTSVLNVSSLHAEKFVLASEEVAKAAVANITTLAPCAATDEAGELECARTFAKTFGRQAFRRDITAADETALLQAYGFGRDGGSYAEGIEVMLRAMLQSPFFLYRVEAASAAAVSGSSVSQVAAYELASRLSFLIWASVPDVALLDVAAAGQLATKEQIASQARIMLADEKAKRGVVNFYEQWLGTGKVATSTKNQSLFPAYTKDAQAALAVELPAFMTDLLWNGDRKLSTMFTSNTAFVTKDTAPIYGVTNVTSTTPVAATLPADQERAGVLTQASFLSVQAHPDQTSPVLRGKFVRSKLMCQPPDPPPPDEDISVPEVEEGATARERFSAHFAAGNSCSNCHALMDPIGFAFEHFDAIGEYRLQENGRDIDVSGSVVGGTGSLEGDFSGVQELGTKLAGSSVVQNCVATQWFRYAAGRNEAPGDECSLSTLQSQFAAADGDLVELVVAMTQTDAFVYRPVAEVTQ